MRATLPVYLIQAILLLSAASSEDADRCPTPSISNAALQTPLTLWDLGFSLKDKWMDLREEEACPVPPDLICIEGGAECGDQQIMEQVAASIRPTESTTAQERAEMPTGAVEVEEDLVSFEDWKRRKLGEEDDSTESQETRETTVTPHDTSSSQSSSSNREASQSSEAARQVNKTNGENKTLEEKDNSNSSVPKPKPKADKDRGESLKAPAHNKYNYASPDCSARIHSSSRLTQHASSLLHKSRDRYMLTPCKADEHWVVVELCDEIRIEAIEIAVWEFFSGVVREVQVSVGGANEDEEDEDPAQDGENVSRVPKWETVGTFFGKNIRGVQTFTLPQATSFQRFVRLDFPTYFGTEYYCPVSQLKVYGMNQMEAFKSEQKRLAATAKDRDKEKINKDKEAEERRQRDQHELETRVREQIRQEDKQREQELDNLERLVLQQARQGNALPELTPLPNPKDLESIGITTVTSSSSTTSSASTVVASAPTAANRSEPATYNQSNAETEQNKTTSYTSSQTTKAAAPRSDSSESIYAHIIRRLNALEGNSSLVARYIEEQAKVMRHMLTRVERGWDEWRVEREVEELSRWDQERMRQEDRLGKVISQMEQQRLAMDSERRAVLTELRVLSAELGYERRRGIAQLLITLVIIALGVASRSSTIDAVLKPLVAEARRRRSMKSISGPLSGLEIDMGPKRPPAVVGQTPTHQVDLAKARDTDSSSIKYQHHRTSSMKRPTTPRRRHMTGPTSPYMRIFSDSTPYLASILTTPSTQPPIASPFSFNPASTSNSNMTPNSKITKPRGSLPPSRIVGGSRKLARSAHLHPMEADRARHEIKLGSTVRLPTDGESTPRADGYSDSPSPTSNPFVPPGDRMISPLTAGDAVFADGLDPPDDLDGRSDWGTDAGESASEVENDMLHDEPEDLHIVEDLNKVWTNGTQVKTEKTNT